ILKFPGRPEGGDKKERKKVRRLEEGKFYDLNPPANINGEIYDRVQCEYQVPNQRDTYVVRGIPRGETKQKSFVLKLSTERGVTVFESEDQN
ncbi:MAG: hypothetical protein AAB967_02060, partial [Patescibacteria group bacterium]